MRFVFVMDPMERTIFDKDTSYALMRAASARGHECLHGEANGLSILDGEAFLRVRTIRILSVAPFFVYGQEERVRLADVSAIFIRKDPPFDTEYLHLTHILERVRGRAVVVNDPRGIRDANEKLYATHFARHMPRTLVSSHREEILEFARELKHAVIKPLDGAGGSGVLRLSEGDQNARSIVDLLTADGRRLAMVQEYLPAVRAGDKRILLLEGKVLGAINRVPREDDVRSNIHVGGSVFETEVTPEERAIVADLAPRLVADGLVFVGLDVIGGKLTEVNVTSPTGIQELSRHVGKDMADPVIAWVEKRAGDLYPARPSLV